MSTDNKESRNVAKVVMTPELVGDIMGVERDYEIVDAKFENGTVHITFSGPGFHPITEDQEVPVIVGQISLDGNGNRTWSWGEYLS